MRILLVGEYSRLHNSLKEGLQSLGHEVYILAGGDGFKKYPVDININHSYNTWFLRKFKAMIFRFTKIDLSGIEVYRKAVKGLDQLPDFDIVQLINETTIKSTAKLEVKFLDKVLKKTKKLFMLSCGVDYVCMKYMMEEVPRYSLMSAYIQNKSLYNTYRFQLQYLEKPFVALHHYILENCKGVITSDFDYHLPYLKYNSDKYLGLIPNPINVDKIKYKPIEISGKIKIFHGINTSGVHKKGNKYFTEALKLISEKYASKIEVQVTEDLPYNQYINIYNNCHILLDQVYGYDQGYNALEAMAKGKVVFSGGEKEWEKYYNVEEDEVLINVIPDAQQIFKKLEKLILNPSLIYDISKNARNFIEKEHNYIKSAEKYLLKWNNA